MLCFLPKLFFTQLLVGLIQQVRKRGWAGGCVGRCAAVRFARPALPELTLCPPLQWMVPTIQNSMKPFKVNGQPPRWLGVGPGGGGPGSQLRLVSAGHGLLAHH